MVRSGFTGNGSQRQRLFRNQEFTNWHILSLSMANLGNMTYAPMQPDVCHSVRPKSVAKGPKFGRWRGVCEKIDCPFANYCILTNLHPPPNHLAGTKSQQRSLKLPPDPPPPPTTSETCSSEKKMKFIKSARNWRPISGTQTFFMGL